MTRGIRNRGAGTPILAIFAMLVLNAPGLAQSQPQVKGQWTTRPEIISINPVHAGLLRTGEVLVIAGSGNQPSQTVYQAAVWDPKAGTIAVQNMPWDVWCNGMSFLPDGRALITGGSKPYPTNDFRGLRNTTIFNPATSSFSRVEDMAHGRWYPTNVALPDGRTATFSGYDETGNLNKTFEIYTVGSGWSAERPMNWPATPPIYPRAHLTPAGDLFFSGWQRQAHRLDPQTLRWTFDVALTRYGATRRYGSSVLLALRPPEYTARILIAGGGLSGPATNSAEVIDVSRTPLQWNQTGALNHARVQHNAVLLPDGRVLAVGGSKTNNVADTDGGGRFSERYEPETGDWTVMDQQAYWRFYHSIALLLPDGSVASFGGNPKQGTYEKRIEIYHPPYLFTSNGAPAPRPTVTGVPAQIGYAAAFDVTMPAPGAIEEAVLMRPGAPTHAFDMEQRMVGLAPPAVVGGKLRLVGPPNANIAPPGYYMLFLIDSAGVPSVARFVRLAADSNNDPPNGQITSPSADVTITAGNSVSFAGSGSDPDGTIASYAWLFPGGNPASSSAQNPGSVRFASPGSFQVSMTVTDNAGAQDPTPASRTITVNPASGGGKNLVIEGLVLNKTSVVRGGTVTANYSVVNRGTATVTESYLERMYLRNPATGAEVFLAVTPVHGRDLAPNDVYGYVKTGTIPAGTAAGDYTIVIRADADGTVPEVNEGDNTAGKPLKVMP